MLTADPTLGRHLLSVVAAVGLVPDEPSGDDGLRRCWRTAAAVLVGLDRADAVDALALPPRPEVYVVGRDDEAAATYAWSTRLRAAVATLPSGAPDLAAALALVVSAVERGVVLSVAGGSGGVGTSTLAAALAFTAARADRSTLLLDTDLAGGGIDVLLGAEHLPGWRWGRLDAARGHLGDLTGQLPHCDGVDVLAADRVGRPGRTLGLEQLAAVLGAGARTHDLTVVDLPRHLGPAQEEALRRSDRVLLLARADVRGVAAADHALRDLLPACRSVELVVRTGPGRTLEPGLVAEALDLPLAGLLEEDPAVRLAAERGDPPGRSGRSPLARLCAELLRDQVAVAA